jgi:hypothetical protein
MISGLLMELDDHNCWTIADPELLQLLRDSGSPNLGRTAGSKRVIAETWVPDRVRTISPTV